MGYDLEREKREAIDAGMRALESLRAAQRNLGGARNWGVVDMFGGGFFSSIMKKGKMDDARYQMEKAKQELFAFSRELQDVNMNCNLNLETGDFLDFADCFFDNLLVDWMVQDRINRAEEQVNQAIWYVEDMLQRLRQK